MAACIKQNASKYLNEADAKALIASFETNLEALRQQRIKSGMVLSEVSEGHLVRLATQMTLKAAKVQAQTDRKNLVSQAKGETVAAPVTTEAAPKAEPVITPEPIKATDSAQEGELNTELLQNGLTYTAQQKGSPKVETKPTLETYVEPAPKSKKTNLLRTIGKLFSTWASPQTEAAVPMLTEKQNKAMPAMIKFQKQFASTLPGLLKFITNDTIWQNTLEGDPVDSTNKNATRGDPFGYLVQVDENGNRYLNENLLTAMAMTGYNWMATQGSKTLFNDYEAINKILGRKPDESLSPEAVELFKLAGIPRNVIAETLGAEAYRLLGLKGKDGIDGRFEPKLQLAIGEAILTTMLHNGQLKQNPIATSAIRALEESADAEITSDKKANFIIIDNVVSNEDSDKLLPSDQIKSAMDNIKNSDKIMQELFDISTFETGPSFEPITKVVETLKGNFMKVPEQTRKILGKMQGVKWEAKTNMVDMVTFLGRDNLLKIQGYEPDIESLHVTERTKASGKNQALEREIDAVTDFVDSMPDITTPFHFGYEVWKNGRIGMTSTGINLQGSKVHRHIFGAQAWNTRVDSKESRSNFKLAVAQAFGHSIDKDNRAGSEAAFDALMLDPVIKAGITAARNPNRKNAEADIMAAIELGGEAMHSLDGLMALAVYRKSKPFDTNLGVETDGITNGVIIGLMQSGLEEDMPGMLAAGGVFTDPTDTDYGTWISKPENLDSYERLAALWNEKLDKSNPKAIAFVNSILGGEIEENAETGASNLLLGKFGRKLSKAPLMTTNYGANIERILQLLGESAVENFYAKLVAASKQDNAQEAINRIFQDLNEATGINITPPNANEVLDSTFTAKERQAIINMVTNTYGVALESALNEQFEGFNEFRSTVNGAFKAMFDVFNTKYEANVTAAAKTKGQALTQAEKQQIVEDLIELVPAIKTAMSQGMEDRLLVMKSTKVREYDNLLNSIQQEYNTEINNAGTKNVTGTISEVKLEDGGVSGLVMAVQSIDSAVIQQMLENFDALNVHDAGIYSLDDVISGTTDYNKAFQQINESYSIIAAVEETLLNSRAIALADKTLAGQREGIQKSLNKVQELKVEVDIRRAEIEILGVAQASYPDTTYVPESEPDTVEKILQSAEEEIDFDSFVATYENSLTSENSERIFDDLGALGNVEETVEHQAHLKELLGNLINKVIEPLDGFDVKLNQEGDSVVGAIQGDQIRMRAPEGTIGNNNQISAQEVLIHEMIHAITQAGVDGNPNIRRELKRLFETAKAEFTWEDFLAKDAEGNTIVLVNEEAEIAAAKARYEYIFENTQVVHSSKIDPHTGRMVYEESNNYLHEFLAFGLTNKHFKEKLSTIQAKPTANVKTGTLRARLSELFDMIMDLISGQIYGTNSMKGDVALRTLTEQLVGINHRHQESVFRHLGKVGDLNTMVTAALNKVVFNPLVKYHRETKDLPDKSIPARALHTIVGLPRVVRHEKFIDTMQQVGRALKMTEDSVVIKLAREVAGMTTDNIKWHNLLRYSKHYVDQARKHQADVMTKQIRKNFITGMDKEESEALHAVLLKTDLLSLSETMNMAEIVEMLRDQSAINQKITETKAALYEYGENGNYYVQQGQSLGHFMAQGSALVDNQMLNAYNIAQMKNVTREATGDLEAAEVLIDRLGSLYALHHTSISSKETAATIIEREYAESADNGISAAMQYHASFKERSQEALFNNNKALMVKGYISEIYNPDIGIKMGSIEEEANMRALGFKPQGTPIPKDPSDPNKGMMVMYVQKNGAQNTYMKSIVSLTNKTAKGTTIVNAYKDTRSGTAEVDAVMARNTLKRTKDNLVEVQFRNKSIRQASGVNQLIPIVNQNGEIVDYRYVMSEHTKQTVLEKENRFDIILGKMESSIVDKVNSQEVNRKVLELAYEDFEQGYAKNPSKYVRIGSDTPIERYNEIYAMMPKDMRRDMKRIWGGKEIYVKAELIDLIFGYRKASLANTAWIRKYSGSEYAERFPIESWIRLAESIWQEIVGIAKDNIVIKSFVVLRDNIISNNILLLVRGVPIRDIIQNQAMAMRALKEYRIEVEARDMVKRTLDTDTNLSATKRKNLTEKLRKLNEDIRVNPVKELVDEGVFQSIIEDIDPQDNAYGFKNLLLKKVTDKTAEYVPASATEAYKQAYMTKDTTVYDTLLKATQYSDFVARYALYQHNIKNKKMSEQDALVDIIETFINYDVPTGKELQYLNDMGILMFTKFLFRIQKVIFRMLKENPANALAAYTIQEALGDAPDITDSNLLFGSLLGRFRNPLDTGEDAIYMGGYELLF